MITNILFLSFFFKKTRFMINLKLLAGPADNEPII